MPDYPYVYPDAAPRAVEPGGTRIRVFRRRPRGRDEPPEPESLQDGREAAWKALLEEAVAEWNASLRSARAPYSCHLQEDPSGFLLRVTPTGDDAGGAGVEETEELLEPEDLPAWLNRLRVHLGILVDETV